MQRDSPSERTLSQVVFIDFWDLAHKTLCLHEESNKCIVSSPVPQGWITDLKKRKHHGIEMYSQKIRRRLYIREPTLYGTVDENQCFFAPLSPSFILCKYNLWINLFCSDTGERFSFYF